MKVRKCTFQGRSLTGLGLLKHSQAVVLYLLGQVNADITVLLITWFFSFIGFLHCLSNFVLALVNLYLLLRHITFIILSFDVCLSPFSFVWFFGGLGFFPSFCFCLLYMCEC